MGKVNVTLEFESPEAAIAALGKLVGLTADKAPRKPRNDAGRERGPHKPPAGQPPVVPPNAAAASATAKPAAEQGGNASSAATDPSKAGQQVATSTSTSAQASGGAASAPTTTAAAATQEDVVKAMDGAFNAVGLEVCRAALGRFGVQRIPQVAPEHRAPLVVMLEKLAKVTAKPGTDEFVKDTQAALAA